MFQQFVLVFASCLILDRFKSLFILVRSFGYELWINILSIVGASCWRKSLMLLRVCLLGPKKSTQLSVVNEIFLLWQCWCKSCFSIWCYKIYYPSSSVWVYGSQYSPTNGMIENKLQLYMIRFVQFLIQFSYLVIKGMLYLFMLHNWLHNQRILSVKGFCISFYQVRNSYSCLD